MDPFILNFNYVDILDNIYLKVLKIVEIYYKNSFFVNIFVVVVIFNFVDDSYDLVYKI